MMRDIHQFLTAAQKRIDRDQIDEADFLVDQYWATRANSNGTAESDAQAEKLQNEIASIAYYRQRNAG